MRQSVQMHALERESVGNCKVARTSN